MGKSGSSYIGEDLVSEASEVTKTENVNRLSNVTRLTHLGLRSPFAVTYGQQPVTVEKALGHSGSHS